MAFIASFGAAASLQAGADRFPADKGDIEITTFLHSSIQIEHAGTVIHVDPWSLSDLASARRADLILVTDDPAHHLDVKAIAQLRKPGAPVIIPESGKKAVPDGIVLANGAATTQTGVKVESIAAYDMTPGEPYHPKGEANGYLIELGGKRIYVVGVTECVPEVRAVKNVDIAFMPVNLPVGRMAVPAAVECTKALRPKVVYPYHYDQEYAANIGRGAAASSIWPGVQEFTSALRGESIDVRSGNWYPPRQARSLTPNR